MGFGFWVLGLGCRLLNSSFLGLGFRVSSPCLAVEMSDLRLELGRLKAGPAPAVSFFWASLLGFRV